MTSVLYKNTYDKLLNSLPKWKQLAIKEDSIKNYWSGILTEFIQSVIQTAEKEFEENKNVSRKKSTFKTEKVKKVSKKVKTKKS